MKRFFLLLVGATLAGCGGQAVFSGAPVPPALTTIATSPEAKAGHHVYWSLFAGSGYPQVQIAPVPLRTKSKVTSIFSNSHNSLLQSSGMHVDKSGRLWILAFGAYNGAPGSVSVFNLPLKQTSAPRYTFVLSGTSDPDHLTFDAGGDLWVTSHANNTVFEYTGPFTKSAKLSPAITLTDGITSPAGIALDKRGNLYVAVQATASGTHSIAIFGAPIKNKPPGFLDGLHGEGGLIFDRHGNLYASSDGNPTAIARYNSDDLKNGDTPSILDSTKLPNEAYESDFALSAKGDLYFANCGTDPSIDVYPTSKKAFSSKLAPSVVYTDSYITGAGCAWGIAI